MMNFVKKIMGVVGLLMLLIIFSACKENQTEPVAGMEVVTVAFKMPVDVSRVTVLPVPAETKGSDRQKSKKAPPALPEPLSENSEAVSGIAEYSGEGKIDPFTPLIKNEPVRTKEPVRPRTPLERLDYSQMKLVAIVARDGEHVAMVEEAGGKGYIVLVGTYIGRNGGVVSKIWKDRVIVHERVKDFKGDIITRTQEIKLNKTEDEGI
jgi:type IV pilus assembly protein PilP